MTKQDFSFVPVSDVALSDVELLNQHKALINGNNYSQATTLLNNASYEKGVRASFINGIVNKVQNIGLYLLNLTADPEEYYSIEQPDPQCRAFLKLFLDDGIIFSVTVNHL